jgi:hypothetical protein
MRVGIGVDISAPRGQLQQARFANGVSGAGLLWVIPCVGFLGSAHGPLAND